MNEAYDAEVGRKYREMRGVRWLMLLMMFLLMLLCIGGFGYSWYRMKELRPTAIKGVEQSLEIDKEERKKQNPAVISQFMGKPYTRGSIQDVLEKMAREGSEVDLYLVRDNLWSCNWDRHDKKFRGLGLDPEDAIADVLKEFSKSR